MQTHQFRQRLQHLDISSVRVVIFPNSMCNRKSVSERNDRALNNL